MPAWTKKPFDACQTPPNLKFVGSEIGLKTGAMLPSSAMNGGSITRVLSLITNSPCHSTRARNAERLGNDAPSPHSTPSETRNSSASPRRTAPARPVSSTDCPNSRLTTRSRWPSQSLVLAHVDPLGNFTITRGAMLMASPRDCEIRLHLAPRSEEHTSELQSQSNL